MIFFISFLNLSKVKAKYEKGKISVPGELKSQKVQIEKRNILLSSSWALDYPYKNSDGLFESVELTVTKFKVMSGCRNESCILKVNNERQILP